jgi:transposase
MGVGKDVPMAAPEKPGTKATGVEFTREQLLELVKTSPEAVVELVLMLQDQVRMLRREVSELKQEVRELKERLALNSRNSNKPPGSDGLGKPAVAPKNLREKSERKRGGQPGHPGSTLAQVEKPDHVMIHRIQTCRCGACAGVSLEAEPVIGYEKRQVFDLPPIALEVTEHRAEIKRCPHSGREVRAPFPQEANAPAQYGPRFRGLFVYFNQQQLLPFERLGQICSDLFGQPLSLATLQAANQSAYAELESFEAQVKSALLDSPVLHVDESGLRVEGKLQWVHSVSTKELTFYQVHPKRGTEAMKAADLIPRFEAWVVHDFWTPYFQYDCAHALCNQHLLRELKFLSEEQDQPWAGKMMKLLREFLTLSKEEPELDDALLEKCHRRYRALLKKARLLHPRRQERDKRGKQSKAANLLDRLEDYEHCILAFLANQEVPFTNNQAEQDIRMVKVKQKISGSFRTFKGAQIFARIRGFFSSARKQGRNLLESITEAIQGTPFLPASPT